MAEDDFTPPSPDERVDEKPFVPPPIESKVVPQSINQFIPQTTTPAEEANLAQGLGQRVNDLLFNPQVAQNLRGAIQDVVGGIPSMVGQTVQGLGDVMKFQVGTPQQQAQAIADVAGQAVGQGKQLASDVQSPLGSRESFRGLAQLGMLAAPAFGELGGLSDILFKPKAPPVQIAPGSVASILFPKPEEPAPLTAAIVKPEGVPTNASEITSPTSVPIPALRESVGGEAPLRQQGEIAPARQGIEAQPQAPQEAVAPVVPQPEQPHIVAAATMDESGKVFTGTTHGHIEDQFPSTRSPNATIGFIDSNGRFLNRQQALEVASKSQQVTPEDVEALSELATEQGGLHAGDFALVNQLPRVEARPTTGEIPSREEIGILPGATTLPVSEGGGQIPSPVSKEIKGETPGTGAATVTTGTGVPKAEGAPVTKGKGVELLSPDEYASQSGSYLAKRDAEMSNAIESISAPKGEFIRNRPDLLAERERRIQAVEDKYPNQELEVANAISEGRPVNAEAAKRWGYSEPDLLKKGYIKQGDVYSKPAPVSQPTETTAAAPTIEPTLSEIAQQSKSVDEFIGKIQQSALAAENAGKDLRQDHGLLTKINDWAESTPENQKRFKNTGWFGIASDYWKEQQSKPSPKTPTATEPTTAQPLPKTAPLPKTVEPPPPETPEISTVDHPAVRDFQERPSPQAVGLLPRPSEFVRQDVARVFTGVAKGFRQIRAALTPANVSPLAGQTARIVREHAGQLARDREIATTALQEAAQALRKNSQAENLAIIDRLETGQSLNNKALNDYKSLRQKAYDERIKQVQNVNPNALKDLIENYFPHLWTRESIDKLAGNLQNIPADNPWARILGKKPLAGPGSFLKQRTIPTTADGIALGLEPVTTNPVALDLLKMHEMDRYVMGHKIMQELKDNGLAGFVPAGERPEFGHVAIDDRIARVYGPQGWKIVDEQGNQMPGQKVLGAYYAPEDAARIINNYLSPGLRGNAVYDGFRFLGNAMNQVQLGISAYHAMFTAIDSATSTIALGLEQIARSGGSAADIARGAGQIAKGFVETPVGSMIENLWRGNKFLREYSKPGTSNAELAKIVDAAVAGGARVRMDTFYNTGAVGSFYDALKSGNYTGAVLRAPMALVQTVAKPLMEYTVPRLKLGIISQQLEYELSKLPKNATRDQIRTVAGRVVDSVDNRMGQLIYDNLFWNKALKDGLMASVRSVGWNLGDIRELGGGALDSITAPKRAYQALTKGTEIAGNPVFTKRMAYTFALPFYVGVLGSVYQYLQTGKPPQSIQDAFMPRTGRRKPDGTEERVMLPTYMKDIYPLALAAGREGITGLISRTYRMATNKLHPAISSIAQMIHNQDYYGNQILSPDDPLIRQHPLMGKILRESEFIGKQFQPFSFRGVAQREGGLKEKAQAVAGIMPASRELTDTPAMRMIHDINAAKRPVGGYTLLQQQKREDKRKAQSGEDLRPTLFKRLSKEERARVLEVATPEEKAIFQSAIAPNTTTRLIYK